MQTSTKEGRAGKKAADDNPPQNQGDDDGGIAASVGKRKRGRDGDGKTGGESSRPDSADGKKRADVGVDEAPLPSKGDAEVDGERRKRRRGAGADEGDTVTEAGEGGEDGRGAGLKLRLLRKGDGGWQSKREEPDDDDKGFKEEGRSKSDSKGGGKEESEAEDKDATGSSKRGRPSSARTGQKSGAAIADSAREQEQAMEVEREPTPVPLGPDGNPVEVLPGKAELLVKTPAVVRQKVGKPHESVVQAAQVDKAVETAEGSVPVPLENISQGQLAGPPASEADQRAAGVGSRRPPPGGQQWGGAAADAAAADVYRIPSHAAWFQWNRIHLLEKHALPEFFKVGKSPSKTPEIYKQYRDFIINRYREKPSRLLTFTEVRRMLVGDVNTLRRIFEFLDHWGLINFQAHSETRGQPPMWAGAPPLLVEAPNNSLHVVTPSLSFNSSLFKFETARAPAAPPLATRKNALAAASTEPAVKQAMGAVSSAGPDWAVVQYHCNACGVDCSEQRYHCQKQADFDLCPSCFADGKFGPAMCTSDFICMDAPAVGVDKAGNDEWTDQETLLLLEALELYGDNWADIAEHVATKSKAQCLLHFIRMPIEDEFLETTTTLDTPAPAAAGIEPLSLAPGTVANMRAGREAGGEKQSSDGRGGASVSIADIVTPFADAGNPVMAQVAFLASMVGPRVAAAAAQSALAALSEENPMAQKAIQTGLTLQVAAMKKQAEEEAAMAAAAGKSVQNEETAGAGVKQESSGAQQEAVAEKAQPGESGPGPEPMEGVEQARTEAAAGVEAQAGKEPAEEKKEAEVGKEGREESVEVGTEEGNGKEEGQGQGQAEGSKGEDGRVNGVGSGDGERSSVAKGAPSSPRKASDPLSTTQVRAAAATALAAAAVKAKIMADKEEEEIQRLVCTVIEHQLKKIEIKMRHFDELESMLERERSQIESMRQQILGERIRLSTSRLGRQPIATPLRGPTLFRAPMQAPVAQQGFHHQVVTQNATGEGPSGGSRPGIVPANMIRPFKATVGTPPATAVKVDGSSGVVLDTGVGGSNESSQLHSKSNV